jgi:hypothetical protein
VLDEEDRVGALERAQELDHPLGLFQAHAGHWLVQQQQAGAGGQGHGHLQLALLAVGQGGGQHLGSGVQPHRS